MIHLIRAMFYDTDWVAYWEGGGRDTLGPHSEKETYDPEKATCVACLKAARAFGHQADTRLEELNQ